MFRVARVLIKLKLSSLDIVQEASGCQPILGEIWVAGFSQQMVKIVPFFQGSEQNSEHPEPLPKPP